MKKIVALLSNYIVKLAQIFKCRKKFALKNVYSG